MSIKVFYNEIDPYCCNWLSNLMDAGQIRPGTISNKSIADLSPEEVVSYDLAHFFAGIAGWDHATITDLGMQVQAWTPGPARYTASGEMLTGSTAGMVSGGQLNPALSRWLQGYPKAWDVTAPAKLARTEPSKTPKAKASAKRRGESVC